MRRDRPGPRLLPWSCWSDEDWVYVLYRRSNDTVKVGHSIYPLRRQLDHEKEIKEPLVSLGYIPGGARAERVILDTLRTTGAKVSGKMEWFHYREARAVVHYVITSLSVPTPWDDHRSLMFFRDSINLAYPGTSISYGATRSLVRRACRQSLRSQCTSVNKYDNAPMFPSEVLPVVLDLRNQELRCTDVAGEVARMVAASA